MVLQYDDEAVVLAARGTFPGVIGKHCVARPASVRTPSEIAAELLRYLENQFSLGELYFSQDLAPISDGWETYVYHFQLQCAKPLPSEWRGPLTLRLFDGEGGRARSQHAFRVQSLMKRLDYPVPTTLCFEPKTTVLGGPFIIMRQICGPTYLQALLDHPLSMGAIARQMAALQRRLHRLPTEGFPVKRRSFLNRSLREIHDMISQLSLTGLSQGRAWLRANRPPEPDVPALLHLDFHPINLIQRGDGTTVVLDWDTADVGDPHADFGTSAMLIHCAPVEGSTMWEQLAINSGHRLFGRVYLRACRALAKLDDRKLIFYQALAAMHRLCCSWRLISDGPQIRGAKPSLDRQLSPIYLRALCRFFGQMTGVHTDLADHRET
jgi:aminoglycoside phosphotransferase (APT) family kinase protein